MRVAQIIERAAPEYERKHQRIDAGGEWEVVAPDRAEIAHIYAPPEFPAATVRELAVPYVASGRPKQGWRKVAEPAVVLTPDNLPEAVEDAWFDVGAATRGERKYIIGSFARSSIANAIAQSLARIHRFRDDIEWHIFNEPPQRRDLTGVDVWVDPAIDEHDLDGFVAEALVSGVPVVATRTRINLRRTEKGNNAFLVPANDANELTHAILAALFKPEVANVKIEGARRTASKFRARQRLRVLVRIYEEVLTAKP